MKESGLALASCDFIIRKKNVCPETENQFRGSQPRLPYLLVLLVPLFIYCIILRVLECSPGNRHFITSFKKSMGEETITSPIL